MRDWRRPGSFGCRSWPDCAAQAAEPERTADRVVTVLLTCLDMGAITLRSLVPYSPLRELARSTNLHRLPPPLRRTRRVFGIRTTVARFDGSVYYVPDYAAHRPVAKNILGKRYVSPRLHDFVGRVMATRP